MKGTVELTNFKKKRSDNSDLKDSPLGNIPGTNS